MLETVKEITKYPLRIPSALVKAVKKARENQDAGFFEKLGIFFSAFTDAMGGIEKERNAVSKGTQAAVTGSITRTMDAPRTRLNLRNIPKQPAAKQKIDKTLAVVTRGFGQLDRITQGHTRKALKKLKNRLQGESANLNYNEVTCLGASTTAILLELKRQYPNRAEFRKMLDHYMKVSEGSDFPLKKMMKFSALKVFRLDGLKNRWKLGKALGLISVGGVTGLIKLKGLMRNPIKDEAEIVNFFKDNVLKNTSASNVRRVVKRINKVYLRSGNTITIEDITEFVFLINNNDFKHLISVFSKNRS